VENESGPFRSLARNNSHIHILVTGMGKENAQKQILSTLRNHKPDYVITSGFAGGLDPGLAPETIVFSATPDFPLSDRIRIAGASSVKFLTVSRVICTVSEKRALWEKTGIQATDMESEAIHEICEKFHIPCATVRIISDTANEDLPLDFNRVMDRQCRISIARLAFALTRKPQNLPKLLRFHRRIQSVSNKLAHFLMTILDHATRK